MASAKKLILFWLVTLILAVSALFFIRDKYAAVPVIIPVYSPKITPQTATSTKPTAAPPPAVLTPAPPPNLLLHVPFTPQAPTANWDTLHNEACEEASAIMANAYYNGPRDIKLEPAYVEEEITKLTKWEEDKFGYYLDINTQETAQLLEEVYGLKTKILTDYTEEQVKNELNQNHLVLWPANGKKLGNPNFRSPRPPYHMLVLRGYNQKDFITNDPGTRNGLNYPYTFETLYASNGDFNHETHEVDLNKKMVIAVWK